MESNLDNKLAEVRNTIRFGCNEGFWPYDSVIATCMSNSEWDRNPQTHKCIKVEGTMTLKLIIIKMSILSNYRTGKNRPGAQESNYLLPRGSYILQMLSIIKGSYKFSVACHLSWT